MFEFGAGSGGSGSGAGLARIGQTIVGAAAPSISFLAIPSTYSALQLAIVARSDAAAVSFTPLMLQLNADTGANYEWVRYYDSAGTVGSSQATSAVSSQVGFLTAATAPAGEFGSYTVVFNGYSSTAFLKAYFSEGFLRYSTGGANDTLEIYGGRWNNTAAITQITLFPTSGNFVTGTVATLYGLP